LRRFQTLHERFNLQRAGCLEDLLFAAKLCERRVILQVLPGRIRLTLGVLGLLVGIVNLMVRVVLYLINAVIDFAVDTAFRVVAEVERAT
jgi:hypothetical protein